MSTMAGQIDPAHIAPSGVPVLDIDPFDYVYFDNP